jgi:hypothetical protein
MEPFLIPLGLGVMGALIGWGLARAARPRAAFALALVGVLGVIALVILGRQAQGWDGLGYAIGAFFLLGPATLGCALGDGIEWMMRRRRRGGA